MTEIYEIQGDIFHILRDENDNSEGITNFHEFVLRISKYLDHNPCIVYVPERMNRDDRLEEYSGLDFCNE